MKKVMPHIASVFFAIFGAGVIVLLMTYTFQALARIFPDNFIAQLMGMILFDFAAIAWLGAFIYLCKSVLQYAFAFIGFLVGLLGTLGMVAIEVMLGGQTLMEPPVWINGALVYGFIGAAVIHVILFYAYKIAAPEISAEISLGVETANITEEAMKQAEEVLLHQRNSLGRVIAPRLVNNVRQNLGLPVRGDVLELPAYDVPEMEAEADTMPVQIPPRKMGFFQKLKTAGQVLMGGASAPVSRAKPKTKPSAEAPVPTPTPAVDTKTALNFLPFEAKLKLQINPDFEIHPGMQLEAARNERDLYVLRIPGQMEPRGEVSYHDFMRIVTGNPEIPQQGQAVPVPVINNGNGAHP